MGYYIRLLAESTAHVPVAQLRKRLTEGGIRAALDVVDDPEIEDQEGDWNELYIVYPNDDEIALITRDVLEDAEGVGAGDLRYFIEQMKDALPRSAAEWLSGYLSSRVQVVYAFQLVNSGLHPELEQDYWAAVHAVRNELHAVLGGILQDDGEGFSNREGHHILWQFSDDVTGEWQMAVRADDIGDTWQAFTMDLGNAAHREAFKAGRVPDGVTLL